MTAFVVTGTDTGIGKTVFAAALAGALGAFYWKPVQAGLEEATDSATVARLGGLPPDRILPEAYRLKLPASPHLAAQAEGLRIDPDRLDPPGERPLVIEGAGGPMVPLTRALLFIDVFARWGLPVVLCARTTLGTINHTLLAVEALEARAVPIAGIAFIGAEMPDTQDVIAAFSGQKILGRLPPVSPLNAEQLRAAFAAAFDMRDFAA
ncbi:dethiobiotin synthase [Aquabacter spiritensis]|uniref:ATP-dependent dethiobiotin synthetase BioD n=1 Tax=Aquabacter spiritensis TaxID=933073 RepID=A0A4R3M4E8_9HYPH|nr:dethiobiotin synthase [Aquabacter spiritensis]TCT08171.1 dethiobiotin synthase [Aquabacter spiritensis]